MLSFSQKKKSQFRTLDACSVIDGLASNIKTLIELLPFEDKETFAYLVKYPSEATNAVVQRSFLIQTRLKSQRPQFLATYSYNDFKKTAADKKANHQPSFGCDCFMCYLYHWSRWDSSPNQVLIHEAILLNESAGLWKPQGTNFDRAEWKTRRGTVKCCEARYLRSVSLVESTGTDVVNAPNVQTSSAMEPEELVSSEHNDYLTCGCEKVPTMDVVVTKTIFRRPQILELRPCRHPSKEEIKPKKKKIVKRIDTSLKGGTYLQQEMHHVVSTATKDIPARYKTKQVAPSCSKRGCAASESSLEPNANLQQEEASSITHEEPQKAQISLTHVFSGIVSFFVERLFGMWYPRLPRGISSSKLPCTLP